MKNGHLLMASDEDARMYATIVMENDECGDLVIQLEEHDWGWDYQEGTCRVRFWVYSQRLIKLRKSSSWFQMVSLY